MQTKETLLNFENGQKSAPPGSVFLPESADFLMHPIKNIGNAIKFWKTDKGMFKKIQKSVPPRSVFLPQSADFLRHPNEKQGNRYQIHQTNESLRLRGLF